MNIKSLLVKLLPMFYKLATQIWYSLSSNQRNAATKAVKAVNWLKQFILTNNVSDLANQVNANFGINIDVAKVQEFQDKMKAGLTDMEYNQYLKSLGEYIAQNETPEPFDWKQFALGIIQIAYEQVFKK